MKRTSLLFTLFCLIVLFGYAQEIEPDPTIWEEPWISCKKKVNPKSDYGKSHWILYDLGEVRELSRSWIWNINDPDQLDMGFREVMIDYSIDQENWTTYGQMNFPRGEGSAVYGGFPGPDLAGVEARYILFTVISTHGDKKCAGISEVKFNLLPRQKTFAFEEMDELREERNQLNCVERGIVYLLDGSVIELTEFDSNHNFEQEGGYAIETHKGWLEIPFSTIEKVSIRHEEGNKFNYEVVTMDGKTFSGWSNVFRNFVEGNSEEGFQMINYEDIDYFTVVLCKGS